MGNASSRIFWPLIVWCLFFFPLSPVQKQPIIPPAAAICTPAPRVSRSEIVIAAVGDIMMPASLQRAIGKSKKGYDFLFEKIAKDLSADITFANLETPVDDSAPAAGYPRFNARPALLGALKHAGVTIVSLANNHALDAGAQGLKRTIDNIETAGLVFVGAGRTRAEAGEIKFLQSRDVRVAFLSYTYATNQGVPRKVKRPPAVNILAPDSEADLARAALAVQKARANADLVVLSLHWGDEYSRQPTLWQRRVAERLIKAGADIILGHHPHVLQPIESIPAAEARIGLVAYSLGNFISTQHAGISYLTKNQTKALRGDGIVLYVIAIKERGKTRVDHVEFLPTWALREATGAGTVYRPVSLAREIARFRDKALLRNDEENLVKLLTYRNDVITKTFMDYHQQ
jgi:poly-gamma-glutamate synthesis protein (capsule biosynthesis protein)